MSERRFSIFTNLETNNKNIVDMTKGEPLSIDEICKLLNRLYKLNMIINEDNESVIKNKIKQNTIINAGHNEIISKSREIEKPVYLGKNIFCKLKMSVLWKKKGMSTGCRDISSSLEVWRSSQPYVGISRTF